MRVLVSGQGAAMASTVGKEVQDEGDAARQVKHLNPVST
jgi:hypothetical protein